MDLDIKEKDIIVVGSNGGCPPLQDKLEIHTYMDVPEKYEP